MKVPGNVLTVTGLIAIVVSLTRGPNLGLKRSTGVAIGVAMLVAGVALLVAAAVSG